MRSPFTTALLATAAVLTSASASHADRSILMVLDASGSMTQKLADGQSRMDAAKGAVIDAIGKLDDTQRVGLRVYGHQSGTDQRNCEDSALVTPMGTASGSREQIAAAVRSVKALGYTPISFSLERATQDLAQEGEAEKVVVLVSDGRETCKGDPCAVAKALANADAKLVVHAIGFGVDPAARSQLQCIAKVARGTYYDAESGAELGVRLSQATRQKKVEAPKEEPKAAVGKLQVRGTDIGTVPYVIDEAGEVLYGVGGLSGGGGELKPGIYSLKFINGTWSGVQINAGKTTVLSAANLAFPGGNRRHNGLFKVIDPETGEQIGDGALGAVDRHVLIPGRFQLQIADLPPMEPIEFVAGKVTLAPVGQLKIERPEAKKYTSLRLTTEDGLYSTSAPAYELKTLPPGKYTVQSDNGDKEFEVEITIGKVTTLQLD